MLPVFLLTTYFVFVCLDKTENNQIEAMPKLKYKECQINIGKVKDCMINYQ